MNDDKLKLLGTANPPTPRADAKKRAMVAALAAFDAEQEKQAAPQGSALGARLRSIYEMMRGTFEMNTRLSYGFGTAAIALLLLPLGYQLYTTTAISPVGRVEAPKVAAKPADAPMRAELKQESVADAAPTPPAVESGVAADEEVPSQVANSTAAVATGTVAATPQMARKMAAPEVMAEMAPEADAATEDMAVGMAAPAPSMVAGSNSASLPQVTAPSGDQFTSFAESPVKLVAEAPVSTFSIDVDTASYAYTRATLNEGYVPEPDAVRIEELINYFSYDYPAATDKAKPFQPTVMVYPAPWNVTHQIVQIGIKGYVPPVTEHKAANLVFLIDTSGSMDEPNKLPLLKRAFALLVNQLGENDTISIVAYAGSAGVVLEPTKATERAKILAALDNLAAGGSTAGAEGIELAYRLADEHKIDGGNNRVILATDGDFNVGIEDPDQLKQFIAKKRDTGVFLSVLGFGEGNYGDDTAQALAQNGNGNASYIDSFKEAQKVLVEDAGGTLETIAKDVKIQVEFNPAVVSEYRLIGYETRALNREDFNNDKVDAGDVGAGTSVTALYEITPVGAKSQQIDPLRYGQTEPAAAPVASGSAAAAADEIGFVKLRYKLPDASVSQLIETPISTEGAAKTLAAAPDDARFAAAVAAFGQKLKGSAYGEMSWEAIRALASGAKGKDEAGHRAEFVQMVGLAGQIVGDGPACPTDSETNCR
jgi:Ca-activated chloride channel family protein